MIASHASCRVLPYMVTLHRGQSTPGQPHIVSWIGDHGHHVHVFRDGRRIVKWDMDGKAPIEGRMTRRIMNLIDELEQEGRL